MSNTRSRQPCGIHGGVFIDQNSSLPFFFFHLICAVYIRLALLRVQAVRGSIARECLSLQQAPLRGDIGDLWGNRCFKSCASCVSTNFRGLEEGEIT